MPTFNDATILEMRRRRRYVWHGSRSTATSICVKALCADCGQPLELEIDLPVTADTWDAKLREYGWRSDGHTNTGQSWDRCSVCSEKSLDKNDY